MHERDLRRQALESGKTVSRKARSRQVSAASSKASSRTASRQQSRNRGPGIQVSDDDEGALSDSTAWSAASKDDLLVLEGIEEAPDAWEHELRNLIETIVTRKRPSGEKTGVEAREEALRRYSLYITARYAKDVVDSRLNEIIPAITKSIRSEENENEVIAALKALSVTLITSPSDTVYGSTYQLLQRTITDSEYSTVKTAAIHSLAAVTVFGGASSEGIEDTLASFMEIIESDGQSINAHDEGEVVAAALEEWGFLATHLQDLEDIAPDAAEAFVEQLESGDVNVQIAAGENIAFLYEQSHSIQEDDEEVDSENEVAGEEDMQDYDPNYKPSEKMIRRYTVYRREDQLKHTLDNLAKTSSRSMNKKDKKSLKSNFADIRQTVEHPRRGPGYRTTLSKETGMWHGSSLKVRVRGQGEMKIDTWWKLHRLKGLRRILQGGFITHYEDNQAVFDTLPILVRRNAHWRQ